MNINNPLFRNIIHHWNVKRKQKLWIYTLKFMEGVGQVWVRDVLWNQNKSYLCLTSCAILRSKNIYFFYNKQLCAELLWYDFPLLSCIISHKTFYTHWFCCCYKCNNFVWSRTYLHTQDTLHPPHIYVPSIEMLALNSLLQRVLLIHLISYCDYFYFNTLRSYS